MLDHATENVTPVFPKLFNSWKRAYHLGGKGRDCGTLYFCPTADKVISIIEKNNLQGNMPYVAPSESQENDDSALTDYSHPRTPVDDNNDHDQ